MARLKRPWWQYFWQQPHFIAQHVLILMLGALALTLLVWVNMWLGDAKALADIDWVDVVGESLTAFCFVLALVLLCYLRPNNATTSWMTLGVLWLVLAHVQDALDEWWSVPDQYWFTSVLESLPIGWLLLAVGIAKWLGVHWRTLALLKRYHLQPEAATDDTTGLPSWPALLTSMSQHNWQYLVFVQTSAAMPDWTLLALRSLLNEPSYLVGLTSQRIVIACQQKPEVTLQQWQHILQASPAQLTCRVSCHSMAQLTPEQAIWQADEALSHA